MIGISRQMFAAIAGRCSKMRSGVLRRADSFEIVSGAATEIAARHSRDTIRGGNATSPGRFAAPVAMPQRFPALD